MFRRIIDLPNKNSFLLFGARGTGKTTLLEQIYQLTPNIPNNTLYINLLDPEEEESFSRNPGLLKEILNEKSETISHVIIDEIQKVPKILDVVHFCIEKYKKIQFVLTGSSARKLKHGGANLLAGRAFSYNLYPLTHIEAPDSTALNDLLSWGTLPKIYEFESENEKRLFLKSYCQTYLKQEIQLEQLVRDIVSFREFLDLAAQSNTEIINYSNIASKSGVDEKTVGRYFEILVDTLIGYFLEPFDESVRVRQSLKPKFYLFDTGIQRHLSQMSDVKLKESSSEYGLLFEQWIICECIRLNEYFQKDYRFYYIRTKDGAEIDLIVKKPGNKKILIEIKSTTKVDRRHFSNLISLGNDIKHQDKWVICNENAARKTEDNVRILPWKQALKELFEF